MVALGGFSEVTRSMRSGTFMVLPEQQDYEDDV